MSSELSDEPHGSEELHLLIRCPSCGQRFRVGDDLRGRTVECGACEHRFRITDEVIIRGKKFYPGERKDESLNRFQRVPLVSVPQVRGFTPMEYAEPPATLVLEPTPPQRIVAGVLGLVGMIFMALLLIFGATRGGPLDGMTTDRRMLMAGFCAAIGILLLVYANPRARLKAAGWGGLLAMGLVLLPMIFPEGSIPLSALTTRAEPSDDSSELGHEPGDGASHAGRIDLDPLTAEIQRDPKAVGLWLKDLDESNRFLLKDYILRMTGAGPQSHYYPRGERNFLMVVTGIQHSLTEMAEVASVFGTIDRIDPEFAVVEVTVNNAAFEGGSVEQLTNKRDAAFYEWNKKELDSLDLQRAQRAVQRLAESEPKIFRDDITRKLMSLLVAPRVPFKGDVCRALLVWANPLRPAAEAALKEIDDLIMRKGEVPTEMMRLVVKEMPTEAVPRVDRLWASEPMAWEALYGELGSMAETSALQRFAQVQGMARQSMVRVLDRVGGPSSLPVLQQASEAADPEMKVLLDQTMTAIRKRGPQ